LFEPSLAMPPRSFAAAQRDLTLVEPMPVQANRRPDIPTATHVA
jgi:hypothetical protein